MGDSTATKTVVSTFRPKKPGKSPQKGSWLFSVLAIGWLATFVGALLWGIPKEQQKLTEQSVSILQSNNINTANLNVEFSGRDALVYGKAVSVETARQVSDLLHGRQGIRKLDIYISQQPDPNTTTNTIPSLSSEISIQKAKSADNILVVDGTVSSATAKQNIYRTVRKHFPDWKIKNKLLVGAVKDLPSRKRLSTLLRSYSRTNTDFHGVKITPDKVILEGFVTSPRQSQRLKQAANKLFSPIPVDTDFIVRPAKDATELTKELNTILRQSIVFETGKSKLSDRATAVVDQIALVLHNNTTAAVEIGGHTDNVGDYYDNRDLSGSRARAVYRYLIKKGISASRLRAKGYGSKRPIASNDTKAGRAQNRRIEFTVRQISTSPTNKGPAQ